MENKKLIKILTKDMAELEELIAEMKVKHQFNVLDLEFIHTRVQGILHLLQLLVSNDEPVVGESVADDRMLEKLKEKVEKVSRLTSEIKPDEKTEDKEKAGKKHKEQQEQSLPGVIPEPPEKDEEKEELPGEEFKPAAFQNEESGEGMLQEEVSLQETGARLGDSFLKSKSINDLITDQVKLDYKLSNRPVSSIQAAIGINDRFQYIRELFDGDNNKFLETVKSLDSMSNIQEAVQYLRTNFKWKKNETSLKFVNLVKRRF